MISPSYTEFEKLSTQETSFPCLSILPGPEHTGFRFHEIDDGKTSFLLESVEGGERWPGTPAWGPIRGWSSGQGKAGRKSSRRPST